MAPLAADDEPFPPLAPPSVTELTEEAAEEQAALKEAAAEAAERGDLQEAVEKASAAIALGCASSLMYCRRAELLLRTQRPRAALRDCDAALAVNPDSGKAYKTRGRAHMQLEDWTKAQADFREGLRIDFDEVTEADAKAAAQKLEEQVAAARQRWEVTGGAERGGVVVRQGMELKSPEAASRLSTGAIVEELELVGERLRYRRLTGTGPDEGWISITLKDKVLACRVSSASAGAPEEEEELREEEPFPAMAPDSVQELDDDLADRQAELKAEAAEAMEAENLDLALSKLTEAISLGCATALMYGRRAELLLCLGRPRAARRDCSAALALNPDSGKAFKTRARALVKLKLWKDAHADFQEGLKIDYDDATYEESVKVAGKMKEISAVATARRVRNEEAEEKRKQQQAKAEQEQRMKQLQAEQAARAEAEAVQAKAMANVLRDPVLNGLLQRAKKNGYMADFMGVKRGACSKCKFCEVYLWRPVKLSS